ncbi:MAG TPA: DinB family protein, partial [Longimicrobium sp.]|nr:DinB family protein [Longimicrobium sp.]
MPHGNGNAPSARDLAELLLDARTRTLLLVSSVPEDELMAQHNKLMSPIVWDLGHIAHFEELWLIRNLEGPVEFGEMPGMFNPFENPRSVRGQLALPRLSDSLEVMAQTRRRVLEHVTNAGAPKEGDYDPLLRGGYVYKMVLQHEYQHNETILQALQLKD